MRCCAMQTHRVEDGSPATCAPRRTAARNAGASQRLEIRSQKSAPTSDLCPSPRLAAQQLQRRDLALLLDLLHRARARRLVGTPAEEFRAVTEAGASEVVVTNLDHQLGRQRLPLGAALGRPAARSARG